MKKTILTILTLSSLLSAESFTYTEYVSVSSSKPRYQTTSQRVPYQECYDERVRVNRAYGGGGYDDRDRVAASVLGGAIGGVLGHQIGKGKGKDAATIGGAILGTIVGGKMAEQHSAQRVYSVPQYQTRRRCVTKYRVTRGVSELVGYENIAYYHGRKIVKFSDQPLSTIPITITVSY